ncbi:mucin-associated surface protein (MASP), putative, partial [Trypanosoma cruzi marinkellei]
MEWSALSMDECRRQLNCCLVMNIGCASRGPTIHVVCGDLLFSYLLLCFCVAVCEKLLLPTKGGGESQLPVTADENTSNTTIPDISDSSLAATTAVRYEASTEGSRTISDLSLSSSEDDARPNNTPDGDDASHMTEDAVTPSAGNPIPQQAAARTNDTATTGDSDSSTAASHTTSPLLLLVVVECAAAAGGGYACMKWSALSMDECRRQLNCCLVMNIGCASRGPTIHVVCGDLLFSYLL